MRSSLLRRGLLTGLLAAVTAITASGTAGAAAPEGDVIHAASRPIAGHYVVFFDESRASLSSTAIAAASASLVDRYGGSLRSVWDTAVHGFSVTGMDETQARRLAADPSVRQVRQSGTAVAFDEQANPPSYGLDRVDQRKLPLDSKYIYNNTSAGVNVYVTDTGIKYTHQEFEGRAKLGADFINDGRNGEDCFGHGTHVSGTIAGKTVGLAKKANLFSVRMLGQNCGNTGPDSAGIDALNWIAKNAVKPAVVNMSWGFDDAHIGDAALKAVNDAGIPMVAAAGNNGGDGCSFGPGGVYAPIINVGNSNKTDNKSGTSNYGSCLDLWAPGENIYSAYYSSNTAYSNMTGTSMASPHVAGAVALYLQGHPSATPAQVQDFIVTGSTPDVLQGNIGSGSPNKLLYSRGDSGPPPGNDFSIGVSPSQVSVAPGSAVSASVATTLVSGTAESVALSASGLPSGVTATFQPESVTAGESAKLSLAASAGAQPGTYPLTVTGRAASATHDAPLSLVVTGGPGGGNDFSLSLSPTSGTVQAGQSTTSTVSTTVVTGTAETVRLTASGLPTGVTATFDPSSVTAGGTSRLTVATASSTAAGTYSVKVTGSADSATHDATFTLTVTRVQPGNGIQNGGFETGTLTGWTPTGTTGVTGPGRTGSYAAKLGGASGTSSISQTFTVPTGKSTLSLYYRQSNCATFNDQTVVELTDTATGQKQTLATGYCFNGTFWWPAQGTVTTGHSYTITVRHTTTGQSSAAIDDVVLS
ncbi:hypothetical protein Afil01_27120 [Actinorhabdospora filicis]|uniref:Peptidase S8/S53 domain-containing protein n=1 Tax=Actinorhabdospora filicis TaxID=1785913 RepID=A0A9W6SIX0_9ACTN|nr:S8 family serine peptidase [Actinorhabdospora filicis]GLZ77905.1 hypothetical protein Afil01_27120 [Actinorhabdospora filicis]